MTLRNISLLLILCIVAACSTVSSSLQYTEGTQALERGDYDRAATLLAEAVRLDPSLSRNHNNLAAALFELGRFKEGWPHVRQAVLLDPRNQGAAANNRRFTIALLDGAGLEIGSTQAAVTAALGEPDNGSQGEECTWLQYGVSALCFKEGILKSIDDMAYQ